MASILSFRQSNVVLSPRCLLAFNKLTMYPQCPSRELYHIKYKNNVPKNIQKIEHKHVSEGVGLYCMALEQKLEGNLPTWTWYPALYSLNGFDFPLLSWKLCPFPLSCQQRPLGKLNPVRGATEFTYMWHWILVTWRVNNWHFRTFHSDCDSFTFLHHWPTGGTRNTAAITLDC